MSRFRLPPESDGSVEDRPLPGATGLVRIEELPPAAAPKPHCEFCSGHPGFVFDVRGERAVAAPCSCIPVCPRCLDTGTVTAIVEGVVRTGRCRCQRVHDRVRLFNAAGIPGRYAQATYGSYTRGLLSHADTSSGYMTTLKDLSDWINGWTPGHENPGLILHGPVGRGKTHLLVGVVRELILRHGIQVRFVEFSRLLAQLKAGYSEGKSGASVIDPLVEVPVLAIDELGKGRMTDWELTVIDEVISRRYNAMACTLGSTNFAPGVATGAAPANAAVVNETPQTLGDRVGDRVYSRLEETCKFIELVGPDFRHIKRQS